MSPNPVYHLPDGVETRWASPENPTGEKGAAAKSNGGRKGRSNIPLASGQSMVLAAHAGSGGIVRRLWLTISEREPAQLRGVKVEIFWDGAATPAVAAPLGDFFGQTLGRLQIFESALFSNPEGRSFHCIAAMPFQNGFRIVLTNESSTDIKSLFYDVNYTLGDDVSGAGYFHAHWRREPCTTMRCDYEVLPPVVGKGRYLGAHFGVIANTGDYLRMWWGEGECKIYLDGDRDFPTLANTGTEDYIGTAWGQGKFAHQFQGSQLADEENYQYAFYRYHLPDPVYFHRDIRVTMQQIGCTGRKGIRALLDHGTPITFTDGRSGDTLDSQSDFPLFERSDDWSSCCYFYLDRPENGLPPLSPVGERTGGLLGIRLQQQNPV